MIRLEFTAHTAIYLNHNELITKAYNESTDSPEKYQLKQYLFDFKPKSPPNVEVTISKKRKRKAETVQLSPETIELKQFCDAIIAKLKQSTEIFKYLPHEESTSRIWEEPAVFPQLKGSNSRNDFQKCTLDNKEYLIPPRCHFFNHDLLNFHEISNSLDKYDFVVMDPPWKNKYIRRIKKAKQELGYKMLNNDLLSDIPLSSLIHDDSIVAVWCTNSNQHQQRLLGEFFPRWDLYLIQKILWLKLNTDGTLIGEINEEGKKQPYEVLFIASHSKSKKDFSELRKLKFILSIPSVIHSHKPPIAELFREILPENPKCLEFFARYLQPGFTSIGLEVIKLMDIRLYSENKERRSV